MSQLTYRSRDIVVVLVLMALGAVLFLPFIYSPFVVDDLPQIVDFSLVHSLGNIPTLFFGGFGFQREYFDFVNFYWRPLMFSLYAFLYWLGGGSPVVFHLFQIAVVVVNSMLFYLFLTKLVRRENAFFCAVLFLTIPVNRDVAMLIAYVQDGLFFCFGMLALLVVDLASFGKKQKFVLVFILLLASILAKETGIIFVFLILLYLYLFKRREWKPYFFVSLAALFSYLVLRYWAAHYIYKLLVVTRYTDVTLKQKLLTVFSTLRFHLQDIFMPGVGQFPIFEGKLLSVEYGLVSGGLILVFAIVLFCLGLIVRLSDKKQIRVFIFFVLWLTVGFLFHAQIFSLETFIGRRWMYLPVAGILGVVASVLTAIVKENWHRRLVFLGFLIVVVYYCESHLLTF